MVLPCKSPEEKGPISSQDAQSTFGRRMTQQEASGGKNPPLIHTDSDDQAKTQTLGLVIPSAVLFGAGAS